MYSGERVKKLLEESKLLPADLSEKLYGTRTRGLTSILTADANPTARLLETIAEFFHVPIDSLFDSNTDPVPLSDVEYLTRAVYKKELEAKEREIEALKTRISDLLETKEVMRTQIALLQAKGQDEKEGRTRKKKD